MNFIDGVLAGKVSTDEIGDYRDRWDEVHQGVPFHTFLGLSWYEYAMWVGNGEALEYIVGARRAGVDLHGYLAQLRYSDPTADPLYQLSEIYQEDREVADKGRNPAT
jgi:hypothetical protein